MSTHTPADHVAARTELDDIVTELGHLLDRRGDVDDDGDGTLSPNQVWAINRALRAFREAASPQDADHCDNCATDPEA